MLVFICCTHTEVRVLSTPTTLQVFLRPEEQRRTRTPWKHWFYTIYKTKNGNKPPPLHPPFFENYYGSFANNLIGRKEQQLLH